MGILIVVSGYALILLALGGIAAAFITHPWETMTATCFVVLVLAALIGIDHARHT